MKKAEEANDKTLIKFAKEDLEYFENELENFKEKTEEKTSSKKSEQSEDRTKKGKLTAKAKKAKRDLADQKRKLQLSEAEKNKVTITKKNHEAKESPKHEQTETKAEEKAEDKKVLIRKKLAKAKELLKDEKGVHNLRIIEAGNYGAKTLDNVVDELHAKDLEVVIRKKPTEHGEKTRRKDEAVDVVNRFQAGITDKQKEVFVKHEKQFEEIMTDGIVKVNKKINAMKDESDLTAIMTKFEDFFNNL